MRILYKNISGNLAVEEIDLIQFNNFVVEGRFVCEIYNSYSRKKLLFDEDQIICAIEDILLYDIPKDFFSDKNPDRRIDRIHYKEEIAKTILACVLQHGYFDLSNYFQEAKII